MTWRDACSEKIRKVLYRVGTAEEYGAEDVGEILGLIAYEKEVSARDLGNEIKDQGNKEQGQYYWGYCDNDRLVDQAVERTVGKIG